ncbi:MAG: PilZ domain-containing protein [Endomicrobiales bacterium]|nr:PilZ domain-containing protein [Endomicrobiales bacterium]
MSTMGEERRKHIRIFLPGGQIRLVSGILLVLVGRVVDISLGGIKFVCSADFKIGDEVDLEVTLPTGMRFKCNGRVCHMEEIQGNESERIFGTQFVNLGVREQFELGEYIMKKRAEQDDILHDKLN